MASQPKGCLSKILGYFLRHRSCITVLVALLLVVFCCGSPFWFGRTKITAVEYSYDGSEIIWALALGRIEIEDVATGESRISADCGDWIAAIAVSPSGQIFATLGSHQDDHGYRCNRIKVWSFATLEIESEFDFDFEVGRIAFWPDEEHLLVGVSKYSRIEDIFVLDLETGELENFFESQVWKRIGTSTFDIGSQRLGFRVAPTTRELVVWDGKELLILSSKGEHVWSRVFDDEHIVDCAVARDVPLVSIVTERRSSSRRTTQDGSASSGEKTFIELWDYQTNKLGFSHECSGRLSSPSQLYEFALFISPSGDAIYFMGSNLVDNEYDDTIECFSFQTGEQERITVFPSISPVALSPNGKSMVLQRKSRGVCEILRISLPQEEADGSP